MILYMGFLILLLASVRVQLPEVSGGSDHGGLFRILYVGVMLSFIYQTRMLSAGRIWCG